MKKELTYLLNYKYPKILIRFPSLIYLIYFFNYLVQLRKWYVIKSWNNVLKNSKESFTAIDFGCGEAQYIVPFCSHYKNSSFIALDNNIYNKEFCDAFKFKNLTSICVDLEKEQNLIKADLALSVGVFQYLKNDDIALLNIYKSLNNGGRFLLYVPINGNFITQFYPYIFNKYNQYESINNRKRVYTENEILLKLNTVGFNIISKTYTYGWAGKLSHELLNSCTTLIISANFSIKIVSFLALLFLFPIILLLMIIDFNTNKTNGNGILILASKTNNAKTDSV